MSEPFAEDELAVDPNIQVETEPCPRPSFAVAHSPGEFIDAVRSAIAQPDAELIARGLEQARANSWESIVSRMERIIRDAVRTRESRSERLVADRVRTESRPDTRPAVRTRAALAGAGEEIGD